MLLLPLCLLMLASWPKCCPAFDYDGWYTDDPSQDLDVPYDLISDEGKYDFFPEPACLENCPNHRISKRQAASLGIGTMKDFLKYLIRGNKTKDDELNTEPYKADNLTLGTPISVTWQ
jgi:hypothetical protein